jgi:ADP-heptose:LPS heptosyltransferase
MPGTNWETKRWPVEKFAALVVPLRERFGLASVLAGGSDAAAMAAQLPGTINLAGKTSLKQLTALLEGAALVVANDSGPMHIAAALGRPLVTPFGPTNPIRTGPFRRMESVIRLNLPCSPCYSRHCSHRSCLEWLEIEPVLRLAQEQMKI